MIRICVFSGSNFGRHDQYRTSAVELGALLAERQIGLVYGGAAVGLMGVVAASVLSAGGDVIGVIPRALAEREVAHTGLPDLRIVDSMHERKSLMAELSDAFMALPGGIGAHTKPCGLLNTLHIYDGLLAFLDHVVDEAFLKPVHRQVFHPSKSPADLLNGLLEYQVPRETKWISRDER